jgi:hypothetical protein
VKARSLLVVSTSLQAGASRLTSTRRHGHARERAEPRDDDFVSHQFGAVTITRRYDGRLVIEAPPEAARTLASLFEGMSRLMASAAVTEG